MKKKIVILIILLILIVSGLFTINHLKNEIKNNQEPKSMKIVDNNINDLINNKEYIKMGVEEKKEEVEKVLNKMEDKKYIVNYSYDNENYIYSYEYIDGAIGTIKIN